MKKKIVLAVGLGAVAGIAGVIVGYFWGRNDRIYDCLLEDEYEEEDDFDDFEEDLTEDI